MIANGVTLVMLISGIIVAKRFYVRLDLYDTPATLLEGRYSVDGGEWKELNADQSIDDHFHKIEIRGKIIGKMLILYDDITLSTKDIWFELKTAEGEPI